MHYSYVFFQEYMSLNVFDAHTFCLQNAHSELIAGATVRAAVSERQKDSVSKRFWIDGLGTTV
jgi:hypothetical protein